MNGGVTIVGLGEALWDVLPGGKVLGGAPLNVACHAHHLLRDGGGAAIVASRVGSDALGDEVVRELGRRGMTSDFVQRDSAHPSSTVNVTVAAGQPTYTFTPDIAWDHLEFSPEWAELAGRCDAICFGTLAQRSPKSRRVIWQFLDAAPQSQRLFDVNLRKSFYDRESVVESCRRSTMVKFNHEELDTIAHILELPAGTQCERLERLRDTFELEAVVFTRGERGTLLIHRHGVEDPKPSCFPAASNADAVGAGDACSAAIIVGSLFDWPPARTAVLANRMGAYVASQPGATPELPREIIHLVD